ncbi:hypothetical protein ACTXT7_008405 [Hymenolepis weldensis]
MVGHVVHSVTLGLANVQCAIIDFELVQFVAPSLALRSGLILCPLKTFSSLTWFPTSNDFKDMLLRPHYIN